MEIVHLSVKPVGISGVEGSNLYSLRMMLNKSNNKLLKAKLLKKSWLVIIWEDIVRGKVLKSHKILHFRGIGSTFIVRITGSKKYEAFSIVPNVWKKCYYYCYYHHHYYYHWCVMLSLCFFNLSYFTHNMAAFSDYTYSVDPHFYGF